MVIRAKLKFNCEENAEELVKAFFSEKAFNPKNKLDIHENECNIEIVFEEKPAENLIEAIAFCDIHFLIYNKENDVSEEKTISIPDESKDVSMEADIPEEIKAIIRANKNISIVCHKIAIYLKMRSYEEFFENFLIEAFKLEEFEINWKNIKELLDIRRIKEPAKCTQMTVSTKIAKMMKQHNIPSMGVKLFTILVVKYYKEYWKSSNNNEVKTEEVKPEETEKDKPFEGLPENAIFNEKISQMPQELAEVDKIKYIFNDALNAKVDYQFSSKLYQILSDNDSENFEDVLSFELRAEIATSVHNMWNDVKVKDFLTALKKFVFN